MVLPIYTYGQPVLRKESVDIPKDYEGLDQFISDMYETLDASEGIGLAAPQVGKNIRVVVIDLNVLAEDMPEYKGFRHAFINPEIIEESEETVTMFEGCLSIPGINESVKRPAKVLVNYLNENGEEQERWLEGFEARVFQHEYDHLEGKMFVDRLSPFRKQMIKSKLIAMTKGKFSAHYKCKPNRG